MDCFPQRCHIHRFIRYLLTSSNKVQFSGANVNLHSSLGFLKQWKHSPHLPATMRKAAHAPAREKNPLLLTPERAIKHAQRQRMHPFDKDNLICPQLLKYSFHFDGLSFYKYRLSLTDTGGALLADPAPRRRFGMKTSNKKNHYLCLRTLIWIVCLICSAGVSNSR